MPKKTFQVVRDEEGWGVVDETDTLINEAPLTEAEAKKLADECNREDHGNRAYQAGYDYACGYYD